MHVCAKCHIVSCRVLNAWRYLQAGWSEDERVERLLTQLEQCDAQLLIEFYAALRAAGQDEIVDLLREGWRMYRTAESMQLVRETARVWLCDLRTVVEISTFLNLSDVTYRYTQKKLVLIVQTFGLEVLQCWFMRTTSVIISKTQHELL